MSTFIPKKTKFKKQQKGKKFNIISGINYLQDLKFGAVGLKSISSGRLTSKQIVTLKQSINKIIKKNGQVRINVFADVPISKKPLEIRMGKGKGAVDHWIAKIRVGTILCEIETSKIVVAVKALNSVKFKLPILTQIIYK